MRATSRKGFIVTAEPAIGTTISVRGGRGEARAVPAQALAPLQHGGRASVALAPQVRGMKQALLKRMGMRQAELTWAGRETLGRYASTLAKLKAIDDWLKTNPMLDEAGTPAPCMALFSTLSNTATRQLGELRAVVESMAREDHRFDSAINALIAEGRNTKAGRGESDA